MVVSQFNDPLIVENLSPCTITSTTYNLDHVFSAYIGQIFKERIAGSKAACILHFHRYY